MIHQSVKRFGEKIMRYFNNLERDRTQNRIPLLLIALAKQRFSAKTVDGWLPGSRFLPPF
jgi:hypothetical protein